MGTVAVKVKETQRVFELCEELKAMNHRLYFMDILDDYVRQGAWSGDAASQFRTSVQAIENSLIDDRTKLNELIAEYEEYTRRMIAIDQDGL